MTRHATSRAQPTAPAVPNAVLTAESFYRRCRERANLVATGMLDQRDAVDYLQNIAVAFGLVDSIGQDGVQEVMAAAFAKRPGDIDPAYYYIEEEQRDVARSTLDAAAYLAQQNDPVRLRAWLAKHSKQERAAIWRHLDQRRK